MDEGVLLRTKTLVIHWYDPSRRPTKVYKIDYS